MHSLNFSFVCSFVLAKEGQRSPNPVGVSIISSGRHHRKLLLDTSIHQGPLVKRHWIFNALPCPSVSVASLPLSPNEESFPVWLKGSRCNKIRKEALYSSAISYPPITKILTCIQRACKAFNWKQRVKNQYAGSIKNNGKQWSRSIFHIHRWVWLLHMSLARFSVHFTVFF